MKPISRVGEGRAARARGAAPDSAKLTRPVRTDPFASGEVIAEKYVVDRLIGEGGVGIVLAAKHLELDESVAIKFLRPEVQAKRGVVERFAREAKALVRIKSEHAARVFDVGVTPGRGPYLVMEYLEGKNLAEVLAASGPLPVKLAVEHVLQACEALAWAHAGGVIHRDVKPENLFLAKRRDGTELIKVIDFGISKYALADDGDEAPPRSILGSPLYMSPEQIRGSPAVDPRSDVWSLGVVLYELVTGRPPFDAASVPKICAAVLGKEPPPLSTYLSSPPRGLQEVVSACLQKDRQQRPQNVAELAVALLPYGPSLGRIFAQRTSGVLRAAGHEAPAMGALESSMPPPSLRDDVSTLGPERAPGLEPRSFAVTANDPESIDAIRRAGRRTRRIVVAVSVAIMVLIGGAARYATELGPSPAGAARAAGAAPAPYPTYAAALQTDPASARVEWRGAPIGETPIEMRLPEGIHAVHVEKAGYLPEEVTVTVAAGAGTPRPVHVTLRPIAPERSGE